MRDTNINKNNINKERNIKNANINISNIKDGNIKQIPRKNNMMIKSTLTQISSKGRKNRITSHPTSNQNRNRVCAHGLIRSEIEEEEGVSTPLHEQLHRIKDSSALASYIMTSLDLNIINLMHQHQHQHAHR